MAGWEVLALLLHHWTAFGVIAEDGGEGEVEGVVGGDEGGSEGGVGLEILADVVERTAEVV